MKRRIFILLGAMVVIIAAGYILLPIGESRISQATCDKVVVGMTVGQLWQVMDQNKVPGGTTQYYQGTPSSSLLWEDEDGNAIYIRLDLFDGVVGREFIPAERPLLELMKRRVERRIRAVWP
jgi:hypothetical protein